MKTTSADLQNRPVNFAVIGCGALARGAHIPTLKKSQKAALHTCCDVSVDTLALCRRDYAPQKTTTDWQAAIADPEVDAICLCTTERLRLPVIAAAAAAGKPVYVEKPIGTTLAEIYEIQRVVHQAKIPFCVGHNRRCSPAMREAHRIFRAHMEHPRPCPWRWDREGEKRVRLPEDGVAGMSVRINDDWYSWKAWAFDKQEAPNGPLLFEMTHFTDMCNWFLAAAPAEVVAVESGMLNHVTIIRYQTGELASISMWANGTFGYPKELYELCGNGGIVVVDHMVEIRTAGIEGAPPRVVFPMNNDRHPTVGTEGGLFGWLAKKRAACAEVVTQGDPLLIFTADPDKGHGHALEEFVDEIRGVGPAVCGVDSAVLATRVAFAALKSAREHRPVPMTEI